MSRREEELAVKFAETTRVYLDALHQLSDERLPHAEIVARMQRVEEARNAWDAAHAVLEAARKN